MTDRPTTMTVVHNRVLVDVPILHNVASDKVAGVIIGAGWNSTVVAIELTSPLVGIDGTIYQPGELVALLARPGAM